MGSLAGLVTCRALHLHPEGKVILAWVREVKELEELCDKVGEQRRSTGRVPVLAFTSSRHLVDQFQDPLSDKLRDARDYLLLYQLSSREEYVLHPIGLARADCKGFQLHSQRFNAAFTNRLQAMLRPLRDAIHQWRRDLDARGRIAWPLRTSGVGERRGPGQAVRRLPLPSCRKRFAEVVGCSWTSGAASMCRKCWRRWSG